MAKDQYNRSRRTTPWDEQTEGIADEDNPLYPVNHMHFLLKQFLDAHSGFDRDELKGYLDLFAFTMNPPSNHLKKVDLLLKMAFETRETLRYREFYAKENNSDE